MGITIDQGAHGVGTRIGFKLELGSFGTPETIVNAIAATSIRYGIGADYSDSIGIDFNNSQKRTSENKGSLEVLPRYSNVELPLIALGLSAPISSPYNPISGVYMHYIEPDNLRTRYLGYFESNSTDQAQKRGTVVVSYSNGAMHQIDGVFLGGMQLGGSLGETIRVNYPFVGREINIDPAENTSSDSWVLPGDDNINMIQCQVYIKPKEVFTLATSQTLTITEGTNTQSISINAGTYTPYELISAVVTQLRITFNGLFYGSYNYRTRRFHFRSTIAFTIDGGDLFNTMGFYTQTTAATEVQSTFEALAETTDFQSTDLRSVEDFKIDYNGQIKSPYDMRGFGTVQESYSQGVPKISGSLLIPDYINNEFANGVLGGDIFEMRFEFTGAVISGIYSEKYIIDLPEVLIDRNEFDTNESAVNQTLNFKAQSPSFFWNAKAQTYEDYYWRQLHNFEEATYDVWCVGAYENRLVVGIDDESGGNYVLQLHETQWRTLGSAPSYRPRCFLVYKGVLHMGTNTGRVFTWNGSTWTEAVNTGSNSAIVGMAVYRDKLHILIGSGQVVEWDGVTANSIRAGVKGGWRIITYRDKLYCLLRDDATGDNNVHKIWEYDGTTSGYVHSFTTTSASGYSCAVHNGKLIVAHNSDMVWYDGSTWRTLSGLNTNCKHLISYRNTLVVVNATTSQGADVYNFDDDSVTQILSSYSGSLATAPPVIVDDRLIIAAFDDGLLTYKGPNQILMRLQNDVAQNPFDTSNVLSNAFFGPPRVLE